MGESAKLKHRAKRAKPYGLEKIALLASPRRGREQGYADSTQGFLCLEVF